MFEWAAKVPKDLAQTVALGFAALLFLYKVIAGYPRVNLSISITCSRERHLNTGYDNLVVSVQLKKGGNGSVALHDAKVLVCFDETIKIVELPGISRSASMAGIGRYFSSTFRLRISNGIMGASLAALAVNLLF